MAAHSRVLGDLASCAVALLLALVPAARADGQAPSRDTTAAAAPMKDLPLTAAERQVFVGTYAVTLPYGEPRTLRILEENGVLKGQTDEEPGKSIRLLYQGENMFRPEGIADFVFTFVVESGRATRFTVQREDGVMRGRRVP